PARPCRTIVVCGKEPVPWLDRYREPRLKFAAQLDVDRRSRKAMRRAKPRPRHDFADYAGDYDPPGYGRMTIAHADGKLHGRIAACPSPRASALRYVRAARGAWPPTASPARHLIFH